MLHSVILVPRVHLWAESCLLLVKVVAGMGVVVPVTILADIRLRVVPRASRRPDVPTALPTFLVLL